MLQVRHVVRHGKGFIVFALTRRCLPVHGADLLGSPRSLNINSSSSSRSEAGANLSAMNNTDASGSLGDGEVLKTRKAPKSNLDSRGGNHSSRSDSKDGPEPGKSLRETAKDLISQFTKGTKVLWVDFKASRQASARKKAGEALTFQEDRQLRQVCMPHFPVVHFAWRPTVPYVENIVLSSGCRLRVPWFLFSVFCFFPRAESRVHVRLQRVLSTFQVLAAKSSCQHWCACIGG